MKYKHTYTAFPEGCNKQLAKQFFNHKDAQEMQDPEKFWAICFKNLKRILNEMNNTKIIGG